MSKRKWKILFEDILECIDKNELAPLKKEIQAALNKG